MQTVQIRKIRSFVRREGRTTKTQKTALETLWPTYGLSVTGKAPLNFLETFQREAPVTLEIGFGDGLSLLQMAIDAPEKDFIGIEVYKTGVGNLLSAIEKSDVRNIRVFCADAVEVLEHKILDNSLDTVQIFFADPWPKSRHHKRRLIQSNFIELLVKKLKKGATLHLATDWMDYAYHMMSVISESKAFLNLAGEQAFSKRPSFRPMTKYEQRGLRLGHQTWDLIFKKI